VRWGSILPGGMRPHPFGWRWRRGAVRGHLSLAVDLPPPVSGQRSVRSASRTRATLWLAHMRPV